MTKKRHVRVGTIEELRALVDEILKTGERPRITFPPEIMLEAYQELGRIVDHVRGEGDPVEVKAEVVSYAEDAEITYRGYSYGFEVRGDKIVVKVKKPCGSVIYPWDFDFDSTQDAEEHAKAFIDVCLEES